MELPIRTADRSVDDWAAGAVHRALEDRGAQVPPTERQVYVQTYATLLERLRERADGPGYQLGAAWALIADTDLLPVTVVEAALHLLQDGWSFNRFVDDLVAFPEERFAEPDLREAASGLGMGVRLQQLRIVGDEVQTSVVYAWPGPDDDMAVTLTAWYASPVDAELARDVVDQLAASLSMQT